MRQALVTVGRDDRVLPFVDDLGYGPVEPSSGPARTAFVGRIRGEQAADIAAAVDAFWRDVQAEADVVIWFSRRSVQELCGLLECVSRCTGTVSIVDVADLGPEAVWSRFNYVPDTRVVAHGLFDRVRRLTGDELREHRATWQRLKADNADLRVLTGTGLESAPIGRYDGAILASATADWQRAARVIGEAFLQCSVGPFQQLGDGFLISRVSALIAAGRLEARDEVESMRDTWVRRPA